jgi:hypothetical protein
MFGVRCSGSATATILGGLTALLVLSLGIIVAKVTSYIYEILGERDDLRGERDEIRKQLDEARRGE